MPPPVPRRQFLALLPAGICAVIEAARRPPSRLASTAGRLRVRRAWEHPDPRPGIDGSRVLTAAELGHDPEMATLFDEVRGIPHLVDGIRCHCGCAELEGYRSLLSCYEAPGMAQWCDVCQGAAVLAVRGAAAGQPLSEIRRVIDARFAP